MPLIPLPVACVPHWDAQQCIGCPPKCCQFWLHLPRSLSKATRRLVPSRPASCCAPCCPCRVQTCTHPPTTGTTPHKLHIPTHLCALDRYSHTQHSSPITTSRRRSHQHLVRLAHPLGAPTSPSCRPHIDLLSICRSRAHTHVGHVRIIPRPYMPFAASPHFRTPITPFRLSLHVRTMLDVFLRSPASSHVPSDADHLLAPVRPRVEHRRSGPIRTAC